MQLVPGTAADTAAKLGLPYSTARLTEDPVYNVTLGASYFGRIRGLWDGNHVLAVASYNAGPGNARKFITMNGDPRDAGVDVIDWIEGIPFAETRDYVQRVLGNAVVLRYAASRDDGDAGEEPPVGVPRAGDVAQRSGRRATLMPPSSGCRRPSCPSAATTHRRCERGDPRNSR